MQSTVFLRNLGLCSQCLGTPTPSTLSKKQNSFFLIDANVGKLRRLQDTTAWESNWKPRSSIFLLAWTKCHFSLRAVAFRNRQSCRAEDSESAREAQPGKRLGRNSVRIRAPKAILFCLESLQADIFFKKKSACVLFRSACCNHKQAVSPPCSGHSKS